MQLVVVVCLECSRRHMPEGFEQAPGVVPMHPLEGCELHRLEVTARNEAGGDGAALLPRPAPPGSIRMTFEITIGRSDNHDWTGF